MQQRLHLLNVFNYCVSVTINSFLTWYIRPVPRLFWRGVWILFGGRLGPQSGPGQSPVRDPGGQSPPGSRREIGKMRVKIQSPRLHFPVSFLCKNCSKFTKIIHKSCTLKQQDWSYWFVLLQQQVLMFTFY